MPYFWWFDLFQVKINLKVAKKILHCWLFIIVHLLMRKDNKQFSKILLGCFSTLPASWSLPNITVCSNYFGIHMAYVVKQIAWRLSSGQISGQISVWSHWFDLQWVEEKDFGEYMSMLSMYILMYILMYIHPPPSTFYPKPLTLNPTP